MRVKSYSGKHLNERDLTRLSQNPVFMKNKWRERLRKSARALAKETDPEKIRKYKMMYAKQKIQLKEWEDKAKQ
jgi:hypothetical protein